MEPNSSHLRFSESLSKTGALTSQHRDKVYVRSILPKLQDMDKVYIRSSLNRLQDSDKVWVRFTLPKLQDKIKSAYTISS